MKDGQLLFYYYQHLRFILLPLPSIFIQPCSHFFLGLLLVSGVPQKRTSEKRLISFLHDGCHSSRSMNSFKNPKINYYDSGYCFFVKLPRKMHIQLLLINLTLILYIIIDQFVGSINILQNKTTTQTVELKCNTNRYVVNLVSFDVYFVRFYLFNIYIYRTYVGTHKTKLISTQKFSQNIYLVMF